MADFIDSEASESDVSFKLCLENFDRMLLVIILNATITNKL